MAFVGLLLFSNIRALFDPSKSQPSTALTIATLSEDTCPDEFDTCRRFPHVLPPINNVRRAVAVACSVGTTPLKQNKLSKDTYTMAHSKEDITYGAAQAKVSEDESLRVAYKHGTPLEAGKIADSDPVDLFADAHRIGAANHGGGDDGGGGGGDGDGGDSAPAGGEPGVAAEKGGGKTTG